MFGKAKMLYLVPLTLAGMLWGCDATPPLAPVENVAKLKAEQCVEPTADMRKNHMDYILHQRDETVHNGIRTKKHSLKECVNCHVPEAKDGKVVRYGDDEHFCTTCHSYTSVSIDCFQCHTDQPEPVQAAVVQSAISDTHHPIMSSVSSVPVKETVQ